MFMTCIDLIILIDSTIFISDWGWWMSLPAANS